MPLLHECAMLVSIEAKVWGARTQDKDLASDVMTAKKAETGSISVSKALLPNNPEISQMRKVIGKARNRHYRMTAPWGRPGEAPTKGGRILTTALHNDHAKMIEGFKNEFDPLVKDFIKKYDQHKADAKKTLGQLYSDSDYPSSTSVKEKFTLEVTYTPVPDATQIDDFRLTMPIEAIDEIKDSIKQFQQDAVTNIQQDLYSRLHGVVDHMNQTLADPDSKRFHKTLTKNVGEIAEICQKLNVTDDRMLNHLAENAKKLGEVDVEEIKADPELREAVAEEASAQADQIADQMDAILGDD